MSHRKINYFHKNKIIYRRDPINDIPTKSYYWGNYYDYGTYECYSLFNSKAKITSFKSLKWHLLVIWHLNKNMELNEFKKLAYHMLDINNGFVTFTPKTSQIKNIIKDVCACDLEKPPKNKIRKIIFKDGSGLTVNEKLSIVGSIIGRSNKADSYDIYEGMLLLNEKNEKITIKKLAFVLNVSTRTIYRNITDELTLEKKILNEQL